MTLEGKSLKHDFFKFIIPSMIAQIVYSLYSMVDGLFVSIGVNETALAAINISMPFLMFLFAIALIFSVGSSTIIAMKLGEGNREEANKMYSQNLVSIVLVGLCLSVIVILFNDQIALFLGATESTMEYVKTYITTIAAFAVFFIASYSFEVLIKTDGYPTKATIIVSMGVVLNCILDYIFVIALHKGVFGAAIATGISQVIVIGLYLHHFLGSKTKMKVIPFKFSRGNLSRTIRIGLASGITELSPGIVIFLFNHSILKYIGEDGIVSYTIIAYISSILVYAITGVAQGIQPLVSYHYGANRIESCKKLLRYALVFSLVVSFATFGIVKIADEFIVGLFISEELVDLRNYSIYALGIFALSYFVLWFNVVVCGYLTAIEKVKSSIAISLGRGLVFVALSLNILTLVIGGDGIWWSALTTETLCLFLSIILLKRTNHQ
ncbi:MAG: MATE family efflux transporter [Anaerovoracaceae bacterium]